MTEKTSFYTDEDLSAWDRVKKAFANDWEQTKADFGVDSARDMDQDVDDTIKQMIGSDNAFENREQAFRFGYTAQRRFGNEHAEWNDHVDKRLRNDYEGDYDADLPYIRYGYRYQDK